MESAIFKLLSVDLIKYKDKSFKSLNPLVSQVKRYIPKDIIKKTENQLK